MVLPFWYVRVRTPPTGLASLTWIVVGPALCLSLEPPPMTTIATTTITTASASRPRRWVRDMEPPDLDRGRSGARTDGGIRSSRAARGRRDGARARARA